VKGRDWASGNRRRQECARAPEGTSAAGGPPEWWGGSRAPACRDL